MNKFGLYTKFKTQIGKDNELISILSEAKRSISSAKGCVLYVVNKDMDHENCIWVTEIWETQDDHANSLKTDSAIKLISKATTLLSGKPEQIELEVINK